MALVRLDVRFDDLDALVDYANAHHVVVSMTDADTIIALGSLRDRLTAPIGVWLEIAENYSAQMAARDVTTLSWLVSLDTVVVSATNAESSAQVLDVLMTNDEVNFTNGEATLVGAYNRPAPPAPVAVWSWDGTDVRHGDEVLREAWSETTELGIVTTYR
jgi:hypothetical protein